MYPSLAQTIPLMWSLSSVPSLFPLPAALHVLVSSFHLPGVLGFILECLQLKRSGIQRTQRKGTPAALLPHCEPVILLLHTLHKALLCMIIQVLSFDILTHRPKPNIDTCYQQRFIGPLVPVTS